MNWMLDELEKVRGQLEKSAQRIVEALEERDVTMKSLDAERRHGDKINKERMLEIENCKKMTEEHNNAVDNYKGIINDLQVDWDRLG